MRRALSKLLVHALFSRVLCFENIHFNTRTAEYEQLPGDSSPVMHHGLMLLNPHFGHAANDTPLQPTSGQDSPSINSSGSMSFDAWSRAFAEVDVPWIPALSMSALQPVQSWVLPPVLNYSSRIPPLLLWVHGEDGKLVQDPLGQLRMLFTTHQADPGNRIVGTYELHVTDHGSGAGASPSNSSSSSPSFPASPISWSARSTHALWYCPNRQWQKNFMIVPTPHCSPQILVFTLSPLVIIQCDVQGSGNCTEWSRQPAPLSGAAEAWRGSSASLIPLLLQRGSDPAVQPTLYLGLLHTRPNRTVYEHRFVLLSAPPTLHQGCTKPGSTNATVGPAPSSSASPPSSSRSLSEFLVVAVSAGFHLHTPHHRGFQVSFGMAMHLERRPSSPHFGKLIISYGKDDTEAWLATLPLTHVLHTLRVDEANPEPRFQEAHGDTRVERQMLLQTLLDAFPMPETPCFDN